MHIILYFYEEAEQGENTVYLLHRGHRDQQLPHCPTKSCYYKNKGQKERNSTFSSILV